MNESFNSTSGNTILAIYVVKSLFFRMFPAAGHFMEILHILF